MRLISHKHIKDFANAHPDYRERLEHFVEKLGDADWDNPSDVARDFSTNKCSHVADNRFVFGLANDAIRIIFWVNFHTKEMYLKFVGFHKDYDKIDARTVENFRSS